VEDPKDAEESSAELNTFNSAVALANPYESQAAPIRKDEGDQDASPPHTPRDFDLKRKAMGTTFNECPFERFCFPLNMSIFR
jgi:hypothetical protein